MGELTTCNISLVSGIWQRNTRRQRVDRFLVGTVVPDSESDLFLNRVNFCSTSTLRSYQNENHLVINLKYPFVILSINEKYLKNADAIDGHLHVILRTGLHHYNSCSVHFFSWTSRRVFTCNFRGLIEEMGRAYLFVVTDKTLDLNWTLIIAAQLHYRMA